MSMLVLCVCTSALLVASAARAQDAASERIVVRGDGIEEAPAGTRAEIPARTSELHDALNARASNLIIHNAGASSFN